MTPELTNPKAVAEMGERIYKEKYQQEYEIKYMGKFVAIDVTSETAYIADSPETAFELARRKAPGGTFHLIKVGSAGAFGVSYTSNAHMDWIFH